MIKEYDWDFLHEALCSLLWHFLSWQCLFPISDGPSTILLLSLFHYEDVLS